MIDLLYNKKEDREWSVKEVLSVGAIYFTRSLEGLNKKYSLMDYSPKNPQGADICKGVDVMKATEKELRPLQLEHVGRWFLGLAQIVANQLCGFNYFEVKNCSVPFGWIENAIKEDYLRIEECRSKDGKKRRLIILPTEKLLIQQKVPRKK